MFTEEELRIISKCLGRGIYDAEGGMWELDELETFTCKQMDDIWCKVARMLPAETGE